MKSLCFLVLLLTGINMNAQKAQKEMTLYYIGDPMCSWCYGFTNEWSAFVAALPNVKFIYLMGGLRPDGTESMASLKDFLAEHWHEINQRTGMEFKFDILQNDIVYNTEPACRAVACVKALFPSHTLSFFQRVQKSFYQYNNNPYATATYMSIVSDLGLDSDAFEKLFLSADGRKLVLQDFEKARELGANGFPTILVKAGDQYYTLTRGYTTALELMQRFKTILSKP
ncbi:MAG: DsbA family protein [Saprospiraceae bacterium]|nr:DsbA family protein [Saprospiraceae bacterium]